MCVDCVADCSVCPASPSRLFLNPCALEMQTCKTNIAGYSLLNFGIVRKIFFPEPVISSRTLQNVSSTSVKFSQNISCVGSVYCYAKETEVATVTEIKQLGSAVVSTDSTEISVVIADLKPDTFYNLYCYTEDFKGHSMELGKPPCVFICVYML
jgi:hypothetical protein